MRFLIFFTCKTGEAVFTPLQKTFGLSGLRLIEAEFGEIAPDKLDMDLRGEELDCLEIELPRERAELIPPFDEAFTVNVSVSFNALNKFTRLAPVYENWTYGLVAEPDKEVILASWISAGCPLEWSIPLDWSI